VNDPSLPWEGNAEPVGTVVAAVQPPKPRGSGTAGTIVKWTDSEELGDSVIREVNGNIAIGGVATPAVQLELAGDVSMGRLAFGAPFLRRLGTGGFGGAMSPNSGGSWMEFEQTPAAHNQIHFVTHHQGVSNQRRMTIDLDGRVGIGTTTPGALLHVAGTVLATAYTTSSSRRFKQDFQPIGQAEHQAILAKVAGMGLTRYRYKAQVGGDDRVRLGFIAEEMPKDVLSSDGRGIDLNELLAFSIAAIQAQHERLKAQKTEIDRLREELGALAKRVHPRRITARSKRDGAP
jgi:hypothetical protein